MSIEEWFDKECRGFKMVMAVLLFVALTVAVLYNLRPQPLFDEPRATVHQLYDVEQKGAFSSCSGVMIAPMTMLTAAHCTESTQFEAGVERVPTKVLKADKTVDLALLRVALPCPCAPLAGSPVGLEEPVIAVGYPLNNAMKVQVTTEGRAQGMYEHTLRHTAPTIMGNSGGGLFAKRGRHWELVGIVSGVAAWSDGMSSAPIAHLGAAVDIDTVRHFLTSPAPAKTAAPAKAEPNDQTEIE